MQKRKICKGCGKELPVDYKYKYCQACRNKQADYLRKVINVGKEGIKIAGGFGAGIAGSRKRIGMINNIAPKGIKTVPKAVKNINPNKRIKIARVLKKK